MTVRELITSALQESSVTMRGCVSTGRLLTLLIVVFELGWDTQYCVAAWTWNHALLALHGPIPAGLTMMPWLPEPTTLAAQTAFALAFYGATKYAGYKADQAASPEATK